MRTLPGTRDAGFESEMATLASLGMRVVARVPTGAAPSGASRSIRAGAMNQHHRITRGKSVAAGAGTTPRTAGVRGARSTTRSRTRATRDDEVQAEGGAFDDALADVFKQLYPSGGVKRIMWGIFKEDVDASSVTTTEEEQAALRDEASVSLTNIDADERASVRRSRLTARRYDVRERGRGRLHLPDATLPLMQLRTLLRPLMRLLRRGGWR